MSYCHIHGRYEGDDGCDECRAAQEEASSERQGILEELSDLRSGQSDLAYEINNPGSYDDCPHCRLRTLLKSASRCPRCHGTIGMQYWEEVNRLEEKTVKFKRRNGAGNKRHEEYNWKKTARNESGIKNFNAKWERVAKISSPALRVVAGAAGSHSATALVLHLSLL